MTTLYVIAGLVFLCSLAIWWGRRDSRKLGASQARSEGQQKVIENVEEADRARRDPDNSGVRRFDRD